MGVLQTLWETITGFFKKNNEPELIFTKQPITVPFDTLEPPIRPDTESKEETTDNSDDVNPEHIPETVPIEEIGEDQEDVLIDYFATEHGFNRKFFEAVAQVESPKGAFREYKGLGKFPTLRFEPHWFNKYVKDPAKQMPFTNNGHGFSSKVSETNHVAYQKALEINVKATIKATSFGKFQIMGNNYKKLGFNTPEAFLDSLFTVYGQYDAFVKFIYSKQQLLEVIRKDDPTDADFETFAYYYNGKSNVPVYSKRIKKAYNSL